MRIVIDLQSMQTESRFRGVGHYTLLLTQAIVRNCGEHEVILALNGLFPETIEPIRAVFDGLLPQENIRVWFAPGPVREAESNNRVRREAAELIRESFFASLKPDVIYISNLFEGYVDDAVTSIGRLDTSTPVIVPLYGFIYERYCFEQDSDYKQWFLHKLDFLKCAVGYLAVLESIKQKRLHFIDFVKVGELYPLLDANLFCQRPDSQLSFESVEVGDIDSKITATAVEAEFWDSCAKDAIASFMAFSKGKTKKERDSAGGARRPRLAFVSPLPPERTGIADYSADLLPALAEIYELDLVIAQDKIIGVGCEYGKIRDADWLRANSREIDRVIYHFGNSHYHQHMISLVKEVPGVVVLHDFYLGHLFAYMEHYAGSAFPWAKALYESHGYAALKERFFNADLDSIKFKYPVNFEILQYALGVIVHSEYSRKLARQWYFDKMGVDWSVIPLLRSPALSIDKTRARQNLGISETDFVVCSFGYLGETKLNHRLLNAWLDSALAVNNSCKLMFVGENDGGSYGNNLLKTIRLSGIKKQIHITGFTTSDEFRDYLAAADMAVQLRAHSRGESSAAVLDCMNYGLPLIVNANGAMAELDPEAVWLLPDEFDDAALVEAIETLWREPERRKTIGQRGRDIVLSRHAPAVCASLYAEAIEQFYLQASTEVSSLAQSIVTQQDCRPNHAEIFQLAKAISASIPLRQPAKRLLLDISATCRTDLKTGIERVARALLLALLDSPPEGFRVEPVYLSDVGGEWKYHYARHYTLGLLGCPQDLLADDVVEPGCGDVLLGLDLSGDLLVQASRAGLFVNYRNRGVAIYFMVYDLLPIRMPQVFPPEAGKGHAQWIQTVACFDGAIGISEAVAEDLSSWLREIGVFRTTDCRPFKVIWSHLGADVANSAPTLGLPENAEWTLRQLGFRPSFLMVGTIEPRKGYRQAIKAFDVLWANNVDVNLVIVGREGWKNLPDEMRRDIPETIGTLKTHLELNRRLFWLEGISDEYLEEIYAASTCLIAASYGEGFGLPLIEAAQKKLPIIARDISVFREVAGEHAHYFNGMLGEDLALTIVEWLRLYDEGLHPAANDMPWLTWKESAEQLKHALFCSQSMEV